MEFSYWISFCFTASADAHSQQNIIQGRRRIRERENGKKEKWRPTWIPSPTINHEAKCWKNPKIPQGRNWFKTGIKNCEKNNKKNHKAQRKNTTHLHTQLRCGSLKEKKWRIYDERSENARNKKQVCVRLRRVLQELRLSDQLSCVVMTTLCPYPIRICAMMGGKQNKKTKLKKCKKEHIACFGWCLLYIGQRQSI